MTRFDLPNFPLPSSADSAAATPPLAFPEESNRDPGDPSGLANEPTAEAPIALLQPASAPHAGEQVTDTVRQQYESFPYPARNPADETKRLLVTGLDQLPVVNHYCFGGRRNLCQGLRVLVAGGGTGDSTIYLAHQLSGTDAEIVHLDLSVPSIEIARRRARQRGLEDRIKWVNGSLLDLPRLGWQPFDYINCCGVLHHLHSPNEGLDALRGALKPDGALGVMVYAKIGRTGVYQMQDLMRTINAPQADQPPPDAATRLAHTKAVLANLPGGNYFSLSKHLFGQDSEVDAGIYDLLLHEVDQAYTVPELYDFIEASSLRLVEFGASFRLCYSPEYAISDPAVRERMGNLSRRQRQALGELFWGTITKHLFWASPQTEPTVARANPDMVPDWSHDATLRHIRKGILGQECGVCKIALQQSHGIQVTVSLEMTPVVRRFVELIDGRRSLRQIVNAISRDRSIPSVRKDILPACQRAIDTLNRFDLVPLRHISVPRLEFPLM